MSDTVQTQSTEAMHTPGPWTIPFNGKAQAWQESKYPYLWFSSVHTRPLTREDGQCTAVLGHRIYGATASEAEANARLIAAVPDYYEAAETIRAHVVAAERLDDGQECNIPAYMIRALLDAHRKAYSAAIAKAEGGAA